MSDIGLPAGFTLFLFSMGAAALTLVLILALLLANFWGEKSLPFRRRKPFRLLRGALAPLVLAGLGMLFAAQAPWEWRMAADRVHGLWYVGAYFLSLAAGFYWASRAS